MPTNYIIVSGRKGYGKDEVANYLELKLKEVGKNVRKAALADKMKKALSIITGIPLDHFYQRNMKESYNSSFNMTIREMMMKFGTNICQVFFGKSVWCHALRKEFSEYDFIDYVIISDVRFKHELEYFQSDGCYAIFLSRGDEPNFFKRLFLHSSEKGLGHLYDKDDFYHTKIENDGTLEDLYKKCDEFIKEKLLIDLEKNDE